MAHDHLFIYCSDTCRCFLIALGMTQADHPKRVTLTRLFLFAGGVQRAILKRRGIIRFTKLLVMYTRLGKRDYECKTTDRTMIITFILLVQSVTQCLVLAISTSFLFLRIHFMLKLIVAVVIDGVYYYIIFHWLQYIYDVCLTNMNNRRLKFYGSLQNFIGQRDSKSFNGSEDCALLEGCHGYNNISPDRSTV